MTRITFDIQDLNKYPGFSKYFTQSNYRMCKNILIFSPRIATKVHVLHMENVETLLYFYVASHDNSTSVFITISNSFLLAIK